MIHRLAGTGADKAALAPPTFHLARSPSSPVAPVLSTLPKMGLNKLAVIQTQTLADFQNVTQTRPGRLTFVQGRVDAFSASAGGAGAAGCVIIRL